MQARMMDRLGVSTHLCLLTVNDSESYDEDNPEKKRKYLEKTMQRMRGSLVDGLRIGDIVTRFSTNQYPVLLPSCTYEDAHAVMKRVLKKIMHTLNNKNITIDLAVQEVTSPK
jgi:PleD family two-component response regulator